MYFPFAALLEFIFIASIAVVERIRSPFVLLSIWLPNSSSLSRLFRKMTNYKYISRFYVFFSFSFLVDLTSKPRSLKNQTSGKNRRKLLLNCVCFSHSLSLSLSVYQYICLYIYICLCVSVSAFVKTLNEAYSFVND